MTEPPGTAAHKVAFVTGCVTVGGSTTFLCNLGGELSRRNIPVEVLSFENEHPLASDFNRLNVPVLCYDHRRLIFEDRLLLMLERLRQFRPTVVVANLAEVSFEVLRYVPPGVFRVAVAHADQPKVYGALRRYASVLDLLAVVSETIRGKMKELAEFSNVPVRYLPLGVPMPAQNGHAQRAASRPLRILYLGRLEREQKRAHLFPLILKRLMGSGIPFHWTITGHGPERAALEAGMKGQPPGQTITFTGGIPYEAVPGLLAEHDVFLLASDSEGLPLTLLEAMGHGLVPVVSDLPSGIRELVDETTGKRVAPENIEGYADAIIWLHEHRDELQRLAENARRKVSREFSIGAMTDRWLGSWPEPPKQEINWPQQWRIEPILAYPRSFKFSPLGRALRRARFRFGR